MSRIHILPPGLADKIAAGEVVERPASVVKELVENAIDAGATHIRVDISKTGRALIQITDNGCGMTTEEAKLSIRRHATSKISTDEDLFRIRTLGFRGEALPSIAAVSHFILETKPGAGGALEGTRLEMRGGEVLKVESAGCPVGTKISVKELFYNTPARLKFLKSDGVELGHIEEMVVRLALGHPDCAFDFYSDGAQKLACPIAKDPLQRLQNCLGDAFVEDLIEVEEKNPALRLKGWVVHPRQTASHAGDIYFYLNGRFLKDKVLQHALCAGFGDFLMKGRYPKAVLYLEMPPETFDVNVHPAKREVRFVQSQAVHEFVARAVKKVLQGEIYGRDQGPGTMEQGPTSVEKVHSPWSTVHSPLPERVQNVAVHFSLPPTKACCFRELKVIGSLAHTYILCESPTHQLILIDQHAAHERIGFEKLKKNFETQKGIAQRLLVPRIWEATTKQAAVLNTHLGELQKAGLEMEPFGGATFAVKSVPHLIPESQISKLLGKIAEELEEFSTSQALQQVTEHILKTVACHAQVRAHDKLSPQELQHLLVEMDEYQATHCPHGRPTTVEVSLDQIEHWFKRT